MPRTIEALIDRQLRRWEHEVHRPHEPHRPAEPKPVTQPIVTISRQHGSRGAEVATNVASRLGYTLLHRDAIDRICESTGYSRRLLSALDEHARSRITQWLDSMLAGRLVDESDYAVGLLKVLRSMAALGGVVVVGRGANFIVGYESGAHVRIVAPREERVLALMRRKSITRTQAAWEVDSRDEERREFIRRLVGRSVDDPLGYDLTINESGRSVEVLTELALHVIEEKFQRLRPHPFEVLRER